MKRKYIVAVVQARMGSKRLYGKVLRRIGNKFLLEIVIKRLKRSRLIDEVLVATTTNREDDVIAKLVDNLGIKCFRGDEEDVLRRIVDAAKWIGADIVVRVTADNPLIEPRLIDLLLTVHINSNTEYTYCTDVPLGVGVEIINRKTLEVIERRTHWKPYREHVTLYIKDNPSQFKICNVKTGIDHEFLRLTVDTPEDLRLMRIINERLGDLENLGIHEVINFLMKNPNIRNINAHVKQKSPYEV